METFGTIVGEWICTKMFPAVMRCILYALGLTLAATLVGFGFNLGATIFKYVAFMVMY